MTIQLHFLAANVPLTKTFSLDDNGIIVKSPYPMAKNFTSHQENVSTLSEFHDAVVKHAAQGHCLLKGQLDRPLVNESRAGHTSPNDKTNWVVFDVDGLPLTPADFMRILGFDDTNYFVQYSASAGIIRQQDEGIISPDLTRYHIFVLLDKPYNPKDLKEWLKNLNLTVPQLKKELTLTATGMSLKWPLDISVCQNDKLIYIAPPICALGVIDTLSDRLQEQFNAGDK